MSAEDLNTDSCGATLAQAREAAAVSQRDVADALHLPVHVVDAIERGDKTRLPAYVFTRGYVRAYAKLLDLDPDPLVTALSFEYGTPPESRPTSMSTMSGPGVLSSFISNLKKPNLMRQLLVISLAAGGVVLVVALILLIGVFSGQDDETGADESAAQPLAEERDSAAAPATDPVVVRDNSANANVVNAEDGQLDPSGGGEPSATGPVATITDTQEPLEASLLPAVTQSAAESEAIPSGDDTAVPAVRRLTADGDDRLTLRFTDKCWVEIKDSQGTLLFGDLGQPGQTLEFAGAGPFGVKLGYASGVIMLYNAEPVALTAHTRNNVAKLVIGQ